MQFTNRFDAVVGQQKTDYGSKGSNNQSMTAENRLDSVGSGYYSTDDDMQGFIPDGFVNGHSDEEPLFVRT